MNREVIVGKYTLESLTNGMYTDPLDLYREYIQNAVDSIDSAQKATGMTYNDFKIDVNVDKLSGRIIIRDNGEGVKAENVMRTLVDIGNSEKDRNKTRGFRGIGRLAGLGYSDTLTFSTSYAGEPYKTVVKFDTLLLKKLLFSRTADVVSINDVIQKIVDLETSEEAEDEHYFEVELEGVPLKEKLLDENAVEDYLIQHAPLPYKKEFVWASTIREKCRLLGFVIPEYQIKLNGNQLYKAYDNSFLSDRIKKREDSIHDINVKPFYRDGKLTAVLWYGVTGFYGTIIDNQIKGIRIRQGNLMIGDKCTCNTLFKEERFNGWMIGELHVVDPELIVNARRDYFEQNEAQYDLSEDFQEWSAAMSKDIRNLSCQRCLTEKKITIVKNDDLDTDDIDDLCAEDMSYGESEFIDREENEEVAEIDYMDKLSWIIKQKQGQTKYMALNINTRLTAEQKKTVERVFDIIVHKYSQKDAEEFMCIIADNI